MKHNRIAREYGFSLIEVMVVILIIGIGAATVRLAVVQEDPLEDTVLTGETFRYWFSKQQDQSLLSNNEIGLYFMESSIAVLSWRAGDEAENEPELVWDVLDQTEYAGDIDTLKIELVLDLESNDWIELESELPENEFDIAPHIILFPSEEYTPSFSLLLRHEEYSDELVSIIGDGYNTLELSRETQ